MEKKFRILISKSKKTRGYLAKALEVRGCFSYGTTKESALSNMKDTIGLVVDHNIKRKTITHLYEGDKRKGEIITIDVDDNARFRDPRTISLSSKEYKDAQDAKERQKLQRDAGYTQPLPDSLNSEKVKTALARIGYKEEAGGKHWKMTAPDGKSFIPVSHGSVPFETLQEITKEAHVTMPEFLALVAGNMSDYNQLRSIRQITRMERR